ncbi:DUF3887 domain-containing protein [Methanocella sp. MCL-LM]|uniref:DUF3887 domain-containing protein n=1 Tax=Methanocella sp. MCL-LM TaxID=3412035 RepID=UPI003C748486
MSNLLHLKGMSILAIILILIISGCIFNQAPPQEAFDAANATAETLFQSFNTGDYGQFSANMNPLLKRGINESSFADMRSQIQSKYGNYTSKPAPQGSVINGYNNFFYDARFEKGTLKIRLVMNSTELSTVDGLWFPNGI